MTMLSNFFIGCMLVASSTALAASAEESSASVGITVHAGGFACAPLRRAWQVLTDYGHLAEFVPNLISSRVLSRDDSGVVVEQNGRSGFLFFRQDIYLRLWVREQPFSVIETTRISGNMKRYDARWNLAPVREKNCDGTRISFAAVIQPDFFMPPMLGPALVQMDIDHMLHAVLTEMERLPSE